MNKYTFSHNGINYERVTKTAARKAYMAGSNVYVQACNLRPFSAWTYPATFLKSANVCDTWKQAKEIVSAWNEAYKQNGTYLFSNPAF